MNFQIGESIILTGFVASLAAGMATSLGAVPMLLFPRISRRIQDSLLGFAAGVMLAASIFSLIVPAFEYLAPRGDSPQREALVVATGLMIGAVMLWLIHETVPHEHFVLGRQGRTNESLKRLWLFVIAITLHNFPEGLAVGVGFGGGDIGNGTALAIGIGLQNVPEGLAVAAALVAERYGRLPAFLVATATGMVEPVGGLIGIVFVTAAEALLPWGLAFAAGAMLFVISNEIVPETHRRGYDAEVTFALLVGFCLMMYLDVTFG